MTLHEFVFMLLKLGQKTKMIVIFFCIHAVIATYRLNRLSFMWNLSRVGDHVTVCVAYKQTHGRSWSSELTIKGPAVTHSPLTSRVTSSDDHMTTMAHLCSFLWQACISVIDWHYRNSFIKTQISTVIILIVRLEGADGFLMCSETIYPFLLAYTFNHI